MKKIDKEKIGKLLHEYIERWENGDERMQSGYDYERTFVEMMQKFEKELFQESIGKLPSKNGKKKSKPARGA